MIGRVLVAGGSGPLGRAISTELSGRGYAVAVHYRHGQSRAEEVVSALGKAAPHCALAADLLRKDSAEGLVHDAEEALGGRLDGVVNCAWPSHASGPLSEAPQEQFEASLDGVRAHLNLCRAALPSLRLTAGAIVFLGGALAHRRHPGLGMYSLGKAAAENACLTLALEEGKWGVRVNVIAPGRVNIGPDLADEDEAFAALEAIAVKRRSGPLPTPPQIASLAAFLVSPDSQAITGQVVAVAGGEQW